MKSKREKLNQKIRGFQKIVELAYNDASGSLKNTQVRPKLILPGMPINTAPLVVDRGTFVALYNNDTSVHFYRTGDITVTSPTGFSDGIPIPPQTMIIVPLGDDLAIRADSALVFAYVVHDDTYVVPGE